MAGLGGQALALFEPVHGTVLRVVVESEGEQAVGLIQIPEMLRIGIAIVLHSVLLVAGPAGKDTLADSVARLLGKNHEMPCHGRDPGL